MGFSIRLQDEKGSVIEELFDLENVLSRLLPAWDDQNSRCLCYVDPWGDTIFNHLQMTDIAQELKRMRAAANTEIERAFIDDIERMAVRCKDGEHLYLKFLGD